MSYFVRSNTAKDELEVLPSRKKLELDTTRSETSEFSQDPSFLADEVKQLHELLDDINWIDGNIADRDYDDDYGNSTDEEYDDDLNMEMEGLACSEQILAQELKSAEAMKSLFMSEHFKVGADPKESMAVVEERNNDETRDAGLEMSGRDPRGKRDPVAGSHDDRFPLKVGACPKQLCCTGLENFMDEATWCPLSTSDSGFHQSTPQKHQGHGNEKTKILDDASGAEIQDTITCDMETCSGLNTYPQRVLAALRRLQSGRPGDLDKEKDARTYNTHETQTHQICFPPLVVDFPTKIPQTNYQPSEKGASQTRVLSSAELANHQESLSEGLGMFPGTVDISSRAAFIRSPEKTATESSGHLNMGSLYGSIRMQVQRRADSESSYSSKSESIDSSIDILSRAALTRSPEKTATESRGHLNMGPLYDSIRMQVQPTADSESSDSSRSESIDSLKSESIEGAEGIRVEMSPTPIIEQISIDSDHNISQGTPSSTFNVSLVLSTRSQKRENSTTKVQPSRKKKADDISDQNASQKTVRSNQAYRSSIKSPSEFPDGTAGERAEASSHSSGKTTVAIAQLVNRIADARMVGDVEEQGQETIWDGAAIEGTLEEDVIKRPKRFKIVALLIGCLLLTVIVGVCAKFFFISSPTEEDPMTEIVENDVCRSAAGPVPTDGRIIRGSTVSATYDEAPQCGFDMTDGVGVWYVTHGAGFPMVASTCGGASFETQISVFRGACGKLLCVVGTEDSCGLQSSVSWATENGELYYILVEGHANDAGEFSLTVKENVRNDSCQAAIGPLPTDKFSFSGSTQDSAVNNSDNSPPCGKAAETGSGVWYAVEGNGYFISANTCSGGNTVSPVQLILYGGACDDLTCIYGYDDLCGLQSSISWNAAPGITYYILVQGLSDNVASFELTIEESRRGDFCDTAIRPVTINSPSSLDIEGTTEDGLYFDSNLGFCGSEPASQVVWYSIVGNGKTMAASTCSSYTDFTAVITVYTGTCGVLECASTIVQDKCTSRHGDQYVSWGTVEGQEYFILVYSDAAFKEGSFNLRLELDLEHPPEDNGDDDEHSGGLEPLVYIMGGGCALMLVLIVWRWKKVKASQRKYEY